MAVRLRNAQFMQAVTSAFFVMSVESAKNGLLKTRNVVGSILTQIGSQTSFLLEDRRVVSFSCWRRFIKWFRLKQFFSSFAHALVSRLNVTLISQRNTFLSNLNQGLHLNNCENDNKQVIWCSWNTSIDFKTLDYLP